MKMCGLVILEIQGVTLLPAGYVEGRKHTPFTA